MLKANTPNRRAGNRRDGMTTVEGVTVLGLLLMLLFVTFDLGLAAFRYNILAAVARQLAREAIVRGSAAPPEMTAWGPLAYTGTAADGTEIANSAAPRLATMKPNDVRVEITWPDGDHQENDRVIVRLNYRHRPIVPLATLNSDLDLKAVCTMRVVH